MEAATKAGEDDGPVDIGRIDLRIGKIVAGNYFVYCLLKQLAKITDLYSFPS